MSTTQDDLSTAKLIPLVRNIIDGQDLSKITPKVVRERLVEVLGNPQISDFTAFKASVKSALADVLGNSNQPTSVDHGVSPEPRPTVIPTNSTENLETGETPEGQSIDKGVPPARKEDPSSIKPSASTPVNIPNNNNLENCRPDNEQNDPNSFKKRSRVPVPSPPKHSDGNEYSESDDMMASDMDSGNESPVMKQIKRHPKQTVESSSSKTSKNRLQSKQTQGDLKLNKLNAVLRELGLRMPTRKLQGKNASQKCDAVMEYLHSKNITGDPTLLSKRDLSRHRNRLEREKDLLGIDTRYGLSDFSCHFAPTSTFEKLMA